MKKRSNACATLALLSALLLLTSCVTASHEESASLTAATLYQSPILRLPKGKPVQTVDGIYTPQIDERWHSDARFRLLEQENINLAAALGRKVP